MLADYEKARKLGLKQVRRDVSEGRWPYLPALDDILRNGGCQGEVPLGTMEIDLSLIAGTRTSGRQNGFSSGFMPLHEPQSEFAAKWSALIDSQRADGIREPIKVYEYLQRFYVQEGNKRVSVMRYLEAASITASVTRVIPMPTGDAEMRIYREFLRFYAVCPIYGIQVSDEAAYAKLAVLAGQDLDHPWPEDVVRSFRRAFIVFAQAYRKRGGEYLELTTGDAFLIYLKVTTLETAAALTSKQVDEHLGRIWSEFVVSSGGGSIAYLEAPAAATTATKATAKIPELVSIAKETVLAKPFCVAFVYAKDAQSSGWVAVHEKGRAELEARMPKTVATRAYFGRESKEGFRAAMDDAADAGADLVVTVEPTQMTLTTRAAVAHPNIAFLNCSISLSRSAVRAFAVRLYEAKFLMGALAASMARHHRIAYVAGTPVFGTVAQINAFAIGVSVVDPTARVQLKWFNTKDDWRRELARDDVHVVCARDYEDPLDPGCPWGLYRVECDGNARQLARPVFDFGRYYELLVRAIRGDAWRKEASNRKNQALNYWWGMSAGVIDVELGKDLPAGQKLLVDLLRQSVLQGFSPFEGELKSQEGLVQGSDAGRLSAEQVARMSWLNWNVEGRLPAEHELSTAGLKKVEVAGVVPASPAAALAVKDEGGDAL